MIDVTRRTLNNGLRVAAIPIAGLRSVSVLLAMEAGQFFEPAAWMPVRWYARISSIVAVRTTSSSPIERVRNG